MNATVADYMSTQLTTADTGMGIRAAYFVMREQAIRHLPVIDLDERIEGIVSDRELRRPDWVDEDPETSHIYDLNDDLVLGDVMVREIFSLSADDNLNTAVSLLVEKKISGAPVLDEEGRLIGMITTHDLLRAFYDQLQQETN